MKAMAIVATALATALACGCDSSYGHDDAASAGSSASGRQWKAYVKWPDGTAKEVQVKSWGEMDSSDCPRWNMTREFESSFATLVAADGKKYVVPRRDVVLVEE